MDTHYIKTFAGYAPLLLVSLSVGGLLFGGVLLSRWDYSIRGLAIAIPFIASAIVIWCLFKSPEGVLDKQVAIQTSPQKLFTKIFFLLYVWSIAILMSGIGTEWYLLIIITLYIIIAIPILSTTININLILLEIILVTVNIIYGITLYYPLYFHYTDIIGHIFLVKVTYLSGHTAPLDLSSSYGPFPLYHILIAEASNVFNLPIQQTLFLITGMVFVLVIPFLYKIFISISGNVQISAFGCLFFSMSDIALSRGIYMTPVVMAGIGFVILFYLMLRGGHRVEQRRIFQGLASHLSPIYYACSSGFDIFNRFSSYNPYCMRNNRK